MGLLLVLLLPLLDYQRPKHLPWRHVAMMPLDFSAWLTCNVLVRSSEGVCTVLSLKLAVATATRSFTGQDCRVKRFSGALHRVCLVLTDWTGDSQLVTTPIHQLTGIISTPLFKTILWLPRPAFTPWQSTTAA
jgi:hypothetical protein